MVTAEICGDVLKTITGQPATFPSVEEAVFQLTLHAERLNTSAGIFDIYLDGVLVATLIDQEAD